MKVKQGVSLVGVQWQMFVAALEVDQAYYSIASEEVTITSGSDGQHSAASLHYRGLALDFRTRNLTEVQKQQFLDDVKARLGSDYNVVLEATHLHVEFDPRIK